MESVEFSSVGFRAVMKCVSEKQKNSNVHILLNCEIVQIPKVFEAQDAAV